MEKGDIATQKTRTDRRSKERHCWCGDSETSLSNTEIQVNGVYPFPHYHAAAHEVLGVFSGSARIQLGGSSGVIAEVQPGDVIAIPAGVGHENLGSSNRFGVVGAYPPGQNPDIQRGEPIEQNWVREAIAKVPRPKTDPVYGTNGPMLLLWK